MRVKCCGASVLGECTTHDMVVVGMEKLSINCVRKIISEVLLMREIFWCILCS